MNLSIKLCHQAASTRKIMKRSSNWLRIGELAHGLKTTTKTIRFYESKGLLPEAKRTASGYRLYGEEAVTQAERVLGLRRLGLSIEQLQKILGARAKLTLRTRLLGLMDEKLSQQDLELSVLQGRHDDLAARHQALLSTPRDRPADCICDALLISCACERGGGKAA